jgi:hypothetical protein
MAVPADQTYQGFVVILVYAISKILATALAWLSGYIAERDMNERYTTAVYLRENSGGDPPSPPSLWRMVSTFLASFAAMMIATTAVIAVSMWISDNAPEMYVLVAWVVFDLGVTLAMTSLIGLVVNSCISNQVYFNYKTEGMRAIRAMRKILVRVLILLTLFPFASALTMQRTNKWIQYAKASPAINRVSRTLSRSRDQV